MEVCIIPYKSKKESSTINRVLYKKRIQTILRKKDSGTKYQLISNILELLRLVRKNQKCTNLQNVRINDGKSEFYDGKWKEMKTSDLIHDTFIMLQEQCNRARTPLSELVSMDTKEIREHLIRSDPLFLVKHLDAFVNNDSGYNWAGEHLLDRDEIVPHMIQCLTYRQTPEIVDSDDCSYTESVTFEQTFSATEPCEAADSSQPISPIVSNPTPIQSYVPSLGDPSSCAPLIL